jgi:hypothetical protein
VPYHLVKIIAFKPLKSNAVFIGERINFLTQSEIPGMDLRCDEYAIDEMDGGVSGCYGSNGDG